MTGRGELGGYVDGGIFKSEHIEAATSDETAAAWGDVPALAVQDHWRHGLSVLAAAVAHAVLVAWLLLGKAEVFGDGGLSLETIAVSIIDRVPILSAPETAPSQASLAQSDADAAAAAARPAFSASGPETDADDAGTEPARRAEAEPARSPPPAPAAPAALASVSSAEASSGVVRAYAGSVSRVLDRQKPRSRGMRGEVRIQFVIDRAGRAEPPLVLASSGDSDLAGLVVTAVQRMEFPTPPPEMSLRQRTFNVPFAFR